MRQIIYILLFVSFSTAAFAESKCSQAIKITRIYYTEKRIELMVKKTGVSYRQILNCLNYNSSKLGDMKFTKPTKNEAKKKFKAGDKVVVSKDRFEYFRWEIQSQVTGEQVNGLDEMDLNIFFGQIKLVRKLPVGKYSYFNLGLGLQFSTSVIEGDDITSRYRNDASPVGLLNFTHILDTGHRLFGEISSDRVAVVEPGTGSRLRRYQFSHRFTHLAGADFIVADGMHLGLFGGVNHLFRDGAIQPVFGTKLSQQFGQYNLGLRYRRQIISFLNETVTSNQFGLLFGYSY